LSDRAIQVVLIDHPLYSIVVTSLRATDIYKVHLCPECPMPDMRTLNGYNTECSSSERLHLVIVHRLAHSK